MRHRGKHVLQGDIGSVRVEQWIETLAYLPKLVFESVRRSGNLDL